jgi:glycosyltransferase involved in cell wall biosynthesis
VRITIVQGAFLPVPPLRGGAVEKVWFALAKEFVRRGHQVTHISRLCDGLPAQEEIEGVAHRRVAGFDTPSSLVVLKLLDLVYSLRVLPVLPEADILVTNTFWLPTLVRDQRRGSVYVHVARYPRGQMSFYTPARRLQAVSTVIARAICEQSPAQAPKVAVIPNPLPENFEQTAFLGTARQRVLLFVGRVHPEKGIELLLNAFSLLVEHGLRDWKLVLVGPWESRFGGGGEQYYQMLRRRFASLEPYVDWIGMVADSLQLRDYYRSASLFVYPSIAARGEALPLAPVEAMACGCPPLVSSLECFKDYLEDAQTGFLFDHEALDPVSVLAGKLKELFASESLLRQVSENAYHKAQDFSLSRVAERYLTDFSTLLHP